ncbi:MAG: zinc-dependent alcohol dehydrogenase family protein [Candidatus Manganitrophus sp. SA1]|nr:zinc-dependent alcohol dehydrogenase family protein [Candidatus Manganitrophus morganii]
MMKVMIVEKRGPLEERPLQSVECPIPSPGAGEVLIRVEVCAICRTDLHVVEGELPVHKNPIVPGHQVVGEITRLGPHTSRFQVGDRVGVAWLWAACGACFYCLRGDENLCELPQFTGYDVDGGYAEYIVAQEAFIYPLPADLPSHQAAPLLCAGIIGYRALHRSDIRKGGRLGLYGFGASAHVVIQIARYWGCEVYVSTRGEKHRRLASELGAVWVGEAADVPPVKLDAAIIFAPAGELVPAALRAVERGGTVAVAGIYMTDIPTLHYGTELFYEKNLRSVTANTRRDGEALLRLASEIPIRTHTELFDLEQANEALSRLKHDGIQGAGVLKVKKDD